MRSIVGAGQVPRGACLGADSAELHHLRDAKFGWESRPAVRRRRRGSGLPS